MIKGDLKFSQYLQEEILLLPPQKMHKVSSNTVAVANVSFDGQISIVIVSWCDAKGMSKLFHKGLCGCRFLVPTNKQHTRLNSSTDLSLQTADWSNQTVWVLD